MDLRFEICDLRFVHSLYFIVLRPAQNPPPIAARSRGSISRFQIRSRNLERSAPALRLSHPLALLPQGAASYPRSAAEREGKRRSLPPSCRRRTAERMQSPHGGRAARRRPRAAFMPGRDGPPHGRFHKTHLGYGRGGAKDHRKYCLVCGPPPRRRIR